MTAVRHLFAWSSEVDVKIENKEGKTAWGILETQPQVGNSEREMRKMLIRVGASKGSSITTDGSYAHYPRPPKCRGLEKIRTKYARQMATISDDKRNALLVVAALLLTVTYQAALSPPGGLKPDRPSQANGTSQAKVLQESISKPDKDCCAKNKKNDDSWRTSRISTSQAYGPSQADGPSQAYGPRPVSRSYVSIFGISFSSTANLVDTIPFSLFLFSNSVTFLISNSVTILLIPDGYIGWMLSGTQAFLWACYIVSFAAITGYSYVWITLIAVGTVLYLILLQAFSVWTRIRRRRHGLGPCGLPNPLQGKNIAKLGGWSCV